ncbi:MAG: IPT/TIG domain-containing protein [Gemmataceae bacterium]|nr:IPT/TIG domain-containing protein [Gemmataceae bacterium]
MTAPAGSAGTVHVTVVNAGGTSTTSPADQFTYVAAPAVTGLSPSTGPTAGGTSVTISGSNFTGATAVYFSSFPASFTVNSDSSITAISPGYTAGTVHVTVVTAGGTSATSSASEFIYADPQRFAGSAVTPAPDVQPLTSDQLQPLLDEAIRRWALTTGDTQTDSRLRQVEVRIDDLSDNLLGLAAESVRTIWIDLNAAGRGWFLDLTPWEDSEFALPLSDHAAQAGSASPAYGRVDLLSVVSHELGHILDLEDLDPLLQPHELMTGTLGLGSRRWAEPGQQEVPPPPLAELAESALPVLSGTLVPSPLGMESPLGKAVLLTEPAVPQSATAVVESTPEDALQAWLAPLTPGTLLDFAALTTTVPLLPLSAPASLPEGTADGGDLVLVGGDGEALVIGEQGSGVLLGGMTADPFAPLLAGKLEDASF